MEKPVKGQIYHAFIDGYASDGSGVAHIEGMAVFVKNAIRDELTDICVDHVGHSAAWGHVVKQHHPCPARIEPDCPLYETCGGCQFRHMNYPEELEAKRLRVEDALRRIGGVNLRVWKIQGTAHIDRYRNKIQFPVSGGAIGYYKARSHQVVDVPDCLLQPERAAALREAVKEWMARYSVPSYDEKTHKGLVRHLYLRFNQTGETLCCLVVNGRTVPHAEELTAALLEADPGLVGLVLSVNTRKTNVILGQEYLTLWGRDWLEETLCGLTFRLSVPSFFQINRDQTETLYRRVLSLAALTKEETVLDLYCGIGTISLAMAGMAGKVIGAEIVPQAVEDAKANAERNGITNAEFFCGDAAQVAQRLQAEGLKPDVVTVDPPRKGLAPEVPALLAQMGPQRIVYVSCDPATLARDVKRFTELGYRPLSAEAVDLFPRTAHVESVVLLVREDIRESEKNVLQYQIGINRYMDERPKLDVKAIYEQLKDKYPLVLTHAYALEHGREDYDGDYEMLCGSSPAGDFQLYDNRLYVIFDVDKADGGYTHWHPDIEEAAADVERFMQGKLREE